MSIREYSPANRPRFQLFVPTPTGTPYDVTGDVPVTLNEAMEGDPGRVQPAGSLRCPTSAPGPPAGPQGPRLKRSCVPRRTRCCGHLRKAYQHVVYVSETREAVSVRLDKENQTSLDGALVWKVLAEEQKTFDKDEFTRTALVHNLNLRENDFGKSLSSIRNDFYRSPRLPLLYDGDSDLKRAMYAAFQQGAVVLLAQSGAQMEPTRPGDINITSSGIMLERPQQGAESQKDGGAGPTTEEGVIGSTGDDKSVGAGGTAQPTASTGTASKEEAVTLTMMGSAFASRAEQDSGYDLFTAIATAIDDASVSFGKFSIELTVPEDVAAEIVSHLEDLGVAVNRRHV